MLSALQVVMLPYPVSLVPLLHRTKQRFRGWNFFEGKLPGALKAKGGRKLVNLTELFAFLMFIIGLLTLIVEVIRLTFEVTTFYQKQEHKNKKD